jgi:hypothetical protein
MIDHDESWAYLTAELDNLMEAMARHDLDAVTRRLDHVRAEAGKETADILTQMLIDRGGPVARPTRYGYPERSVSSTGGMQAILQPIELPAPKKSNSRTVIVLSSVVVFLLVAVVVLVSAFVTRPGDNSADGGEETVRPLSVPPAAAPPEAPATPKTEYTAKYQHAPVIVGAPSASACGSTGIDLDVPSVTVNGKGSSDDLIYDDSQKCDLEIRKQDAQNFGSGPTQQPESAEECAQYAAAVAVVSTVKIGELQAGQSAFCVITDQGNIAWLRLMDKVDRGRDANPDLAFEATLWERG